MRERIFEQIVARILPLYRSYRQRIEELDVKRLPDRSLLTEADLSIQNELADVILAEEPHARIIAEEGHRTAGTHAASEVSWIVDPIDGTAEFVRRERCEFCTVVARVACGAPDAALFFAPELAGCSGPIAVTVLVPERRVLINGTPANTLPSSRGPIRAISATRSLGTRQRPFERRAGREGVSVKTRTTSQSIDLLRLFLDLRSITDPVLDPFDLFYRQDQWLWDGIGGLALASLTGYEATDLQGSPLLPLTSEFLSSPSPHIPHTLIGTQEGRAWFLTSLGAPDS